MIKNKGKILTILFVVALVVLYIIIYIIPSMQGMFKEVTVLKNGTLPVADSTNALIVRDETLYVAKYEGTLDYKIAESEKIRKGTKIVDLIPGEVVEKEKDASGKEKKPESEYSEILARAGENAKIGDNTSDISGVVSYHVDGYENELTPKNIENLDGKKIKDFSTEVTNIKRKTTLQGDPIYKTLKNTLWYLVIWKGNKENIEEYEKAKRLDIILDDTQIKATVDNIYKKPDGNLIVLKTDMYYSNYSKYRNVDVSVIFAEYQGLIVENSSIVNNGDKSHVYVKQKDESFVAVPVNVLATSGEYSVLSVKNYYDKEGQQIKTVNYYEEILTNPEDY